MKGERKAVARKSYEMDLCSGGLAGKLLLFSLPLMLSSLLQLLFNAADIIVVGRFVGKEALAAVGSNGSLINLMVNLFAGLSIGANVVIARDIGAHRGEKEISRSVHTTMTLALWGGLAMMVVGFLFARQFLIWMASPTEVIDLATVYLKIYYLGMPANFVYNFGAAVLRAEGDTQRPLAYLTGAGVVNVLLNLFLVIVCRMGVAGVAIATIAAQYISAILVVRCLMREQNALRLHLDRLRMEWAVVKRIMEVGLPAGFQGILFALSNVVIQSSLNSFNDPVIVAGSAASSNVEGFVYMAMNTFHQSAITFVGQNYGAGQCKRVDRVAVLCLSFAAITGVLLGNLAYFNGEHLLGIYAPGEPEVVAQGLIRMLWICVPYFVCGLMDTMVGVLRGLGYSVFPMAASLVGVCGLRLLWVALVFPLHRTPSCLYVSYLVTWIVTGLCHTAFFLAVRKKAYAQVTHQGPSYLRAEGVHPE